MSTTYALATPLTFGTLANPISISSLQLTNINLATTPDLAPLGMGTLTLTLTDPKSGAQETVTYRDASVLDLWHTIGDFVSKAVFAKLIADGKLPAGTLNTVTGETAPEAAPAADSQ
jgi:hypothetical protein